MAIGSQNEDKFAKYVPGFPFLGGERGGHGEWARRRGPIRKAWIRKRHAIRKPRRRGRLGGRACRLAAKGRDPLMVA